VRCELLGHHDQPSITPGLITGVTALFERPLTTTAPAVLTRAPNAAVGPEHPAAVRAPCGFSRFIVLVPSRPLLAHPTEHNVTVT